jgi:uncharacterized protein YecE (DUF72 family)
MATFVGTSGWRYPHWRGDFYPAGLRQADELTYLGRHLNSAEINGSFYSLQTPARYTRWRDATPEDFVFAVKGGRFITHLKKLRDPQAGLANFFASGPLALERKLGPFLWQLPEALHYDAEILEAFLALLPRTSGEAAELARRATRPDPYTEAPIPMRLRHALEPRHESWRDSVAQLRAHDVALVCADTAGRFPVFTEITADFAYFRLHGPERLYFGSYSDRLDDWAARVCASPGDRYVYFDNDADGAAPWDAVALAAAVSATPRSESA